MQNAKFKSFGDLLYTKKKFKTFWKTFLPNENNSITDMSNLVLEKHTETTS